MSEWKDKGPGQVEEIIFYAVLVEFQLFGSIWAMLNVSGKPYLFLYWGFVGLALIKVSIQKNTWKEWIVIGTFGVIAVCSWRGSQDKTALLLMLGVCLSKNINFNRMIKIDMFARWLSSFVLIAFPLAGICENQVRIDRGIERIYFGWQAPNGMGLSFLIICMEWMYLKHSRFRWFDYTGILMLTAFLHQTANSRTAELLIVGILIVELFSSFLKKWDYRIEEYKLWGLACAGALSLDLLFPASAICMHIFGNFVIMNFDANLGSRFQLPGMFYDAHGLTLFGSPYNPEIYDYLDMLFAYLTLHMGIVLALVVLVLMVRTIWYGYRTKDEKLLLLFLFVLLRSTIESEHFTLVYAFFPVLLGLSVWEKNRVQI